VPIDLSQKTWLADLVDAALAGYEPAAALLRLPSELRGADPDGPSLEGRARMLLVRSLRRKLLDPSPGRGEREPTDPPCDRDDDAFLGPVSCHVGLLLDIALVHGVEFEPKRRRAELATLFAALTGAFDLARVADPARPGGGAPAAVKKAFVRAGVVLAQRGHPAGDPKDGLPLHVGVLCVQRRHLARLAIAYYPGGPLDVALARKLLDQAQDDVARLAEVLAALAATPAPLDLRRRRVAVGQIDRLGLPRDLARTARAALRLPRSAGELARGAPVRLRAFLLQQMLLSELAQAEPSAARAEVVSAFAEEARIPAEQVAALQADATDLYAAQQRWLEAAPAEPDEWEALGDEWEDAADQMMEKVAATVSENLEAIVKEIKQTGELGQLLAKAAAGKTLSPEEKTKVKSQLIDLAKAVPALAIFAAPGGMLLLPLLAKLLPFNVLPSAWDGKEKEKALPSGRKKAEG
jgi:hypothetical protein